MSDHQSTSLPFLSGVVEGFYGRPWRFDQRCRLFDQLQNTGLNTYMYAPKDDIKHRAAWRVCYDTGEIQSLEKLVAEARERGLRFVYALGPGLDITYSAEGDYEALRARFQQLQDIGVRDFSLLFDDIPDDLEVADRERYGTFAKSQAAVCNQLVSDLGVGTSDSVFVVCPTPYCGRMAAEALGGAGYLDELGAALDPAVHVFWTGPEIISRDLTLAHLDDVSARLRRRPLIWDNLFANDYDLRRLYTGPIDGRPLVPQESLSGILLNPNCEFEPNYVPIHTLGRYVAEGERYEPKAAFASGLDAWSSHFDGVGAPWTREELELLAGIYYLPFQHGDVAQAMIEDVRCLMTQVPDDWGGSETRFAEWRRRVHAISVKLTELSNRDLFYTFNRQWWEIREEFDLFARYLAAKKGGGSGAVLPKSPEHLVGTYRGGVIHALQELLEMSADGSFRSR